MGWDRRQKDGAPYSDVAECTDPMCPLYDFRFGVNVFHGLSTGIGRFDDINLDDQAGVNT